MGDITTVKSQENPIVESQNNSVERLHEAKPSENISINSLDNKSSNDIPINNTAVKVNEHVENKANAQTKIETVFQKLDVNSEPSDSEQIVTEIKTVEKDEIHGEIKQKIKRDSNIFGAQEIDNKMNPPAIFSVSGAPSGRIFKRRELSSTVFPVGTMGCRENDINEETVTSPRRFLDAQQASQDFVGHLDKTPRKRSSSSRMDRNPVTGVGVEFEDNRRNSTRKKDGNPLLGLGYDDPAQAPSHSRIPPGGYSKGLW